MSEADYKKLMARFAEIRSECNTPAKATALLQSEGIVDQSGRTAPHFRDEEIVEAVCR